MYEIRDKAYEEFRDKVLLIPETDYAKMVDHLEAVSKDSFNAGWAAKKLQYMKLAYKIEDKEFRVMAKEFQAQN